MRRAAFLLCLVVAPSLLASHARAWTDAAECALTSRVDEPLLCAALDPQPAPPWTAIDACLPLTGEPLCKLPDFDMALALAEPIVGPLTTASSLEQARVDLQRADELARTGKIADALLRLRAVESALPRIADRIALLRAELLLKLGMPQEACDAYAIAEESPDRGVAAQGEIGRVRCAIAKGDRKAPQALEALLRRYPNLPERPLLRYELALLRLREGKPHDAATLLRSIDLEAPASTVAADARAELERLRAAGVKLTPYSGIERVERAERLFRQGPIDESAREVEALGRETLTAEAQAKLYLLAARIARLKGRWEEAAQAALAAHNKHVQFEIGAPPATPPPVDPSAAAAERAALDKRIRGIRGNRPLARLNSAQLRTLFDLAVRNSVPELCDELAPVLATRKGVQPALRFESAMRATSVCADDKLAALLQSLLNVPAYRVPARYHYARALERMGRLQEADAQYVRVVADDRGQTRYYAMWSQLRLRTVRNTDSGSACATAGGMPKTAGNAPRVDARLAGAAGSAAKELAEGTHAAAFDPACGGANLVAARFDRTGSGSLVAAAEATQAAVASIAPPELRRQRALALLAPIAAQHAEAYPWLARALDLIELDRFQDAADEISEAYLAYRDASGAPRLRSGLVALMSGGAPPRRPMTAALRRARRSLALPTRQTLSEVARVLGDPGIGLRFGNYRIDELPRAYPELVERAARKHGLDPNLLFAVMRVESIYNRRIISNAGAVGLMQIMPQTGLRIAHRRGVNGFEVGDLLDPELNVDFAAWYLASLLKRFDGRLPLAIASYNGGPHNVRLWMKSSPSNMPLDAFLERIPFTETHRYVRRVLTHYAAYRAQQNLPMTRLSVELPTPAPDELAF